MEHLCHNPNCNKPLPPHLVSHSSAWLALPKLLRIGIKQNYRAGQENDKRPSLEYMKALQACRLWWRQHGTQCRH